MSDQLGLEQQVRLLTSRLERLELRVIELESNQFELVSADPVEEAAASAAATSVPASGSAPEPVPSETEVVIDPIREGKLIAIGKWIAGALRNNIQGLSGREKLSEPSQLYLVFRGVNGAVFNPVKVFATYPEACRFVKSRGGSFGRSVFIGVPNQTDGKIICSVAEVAWPSA